MGSNLGRPKLSFLFAKLSFGMNVKGQRNPTDKGAEKRKRVSEFAIVEHCED